MTRHFGRRLLFLPGTHLAASVRPSSHSPFQSWNYWWQAHYVDCLVDAGLRELASGSRFDGGDRPSAGELASRVVASIRLRNFLRYVNSYYDDMAWLALAVLRLDSLAARAQKPGRRRNARLQKSLSPQFESASTQHMGGGTFWSTKRDFKNTRPRRRWPCTSPGPVIQCGHRGSWTGSTPRSSNPRAAYTSTARGSRRASSSSPKRSTPTTRVQCSAPCWNSVETRTWHAAPPWWARWPNI
ncbi:glycoside hydrolase, family 76 [Arthrobacter sp. Hiyo8]|nr:glycoside hydrolase, family 76 [Arthrobacter sp. Hiyo8]